MSLLARQLRPRNVTRGHSLDVSKGLPWAMSDAATHYVSQYPTARGKTLQHLRITGPNNVTMHPL